MNERTFENIEVREEVVQPIPAIVEVDTTEVIFVQPEEELGPTE